MKEWMQKNKFAENIQHLGLPNHMIFWRVGIYSFHLNIFRWVIFRLLGTKWAAIWAQHLLNGYNDFNSDTKIWPIFFN